MASLETGGNRQTSTKFEGSPMRLYVTTFCACLCTMSFGFSIGYSSNAIPAMEAQKVMQSHLYPWFASLLTVGAMIGGPLGGFFVEKLGRKMTILLTNALFLVSGLIIGKTHIPSLLLLGRFIGGIACGQSCVCVPVYLAEISTKKLRGLIGSCTQLSITVGITIAYALGVTMDWASLATAGCVPPIFALAFLYFMPETPRFLIGMKDKQSALKALTALRGPHVDIEEEYRDIEEGLDFQETFSWAEFKKPELQRPLFVSISLMILQQLTGINAVMFYTTVIFKKIGMERAAEAGAIIGVVQVIATMVACVLMDRAGRRRLLIIAGSIMAVSCAVLGFYYFLKSENYSIAVISLVVYIIGFSLGWGPIPLLIMSEIFPTRARGMASGIASFASWISAFVITQEFSMMQATLGFGGGGVFWFFGLCCLCSVIFVDKYVPETKGKSLEDIELYFLGRATTY